jgi:hypothetical protein
MIWWQLSFLFFDAFAAHCSGSGDVEFDENGIPLPPDLSGMFPPELFGGDGDDDDEDDDDEDEDEDDEEDSDADAP